MTRRISGIAAAVLVLLMLGIIVFKTVFLGYGLDIIVPNPCYSVKLSMVFSGNGEDIVSRTFLPVNETGQTITGETAYADGLDFNRHVSALYMRGDWSASDSSGRYSVDYFFDAGIREIRYEIDPGLTIPSSYEPSLREFLEPSEHIQSDDPVIAELAEELKGGMVYTEEIVRSIYDYVYSLGTRPFKGTTDAVTTAKLKEASCNGKSRLMAAVARYLNIPSRLVGGLVLSPGSKRTSHQWAELYIGGHWVPFDALNGHYACKPGNYLVLYRGDEALFRHSPNIDFDYRFEIRKKTAGNKRLEGFLGGTYFNIYHILTDFFGISISMHVLQFLLVIPLGVLVVVFARNVIGLNSFGTFLPALMAMSFLEIGLVPGITAFLFTLAVTVVLRIPLEKCGLLHTPKLAVMMISVIFSLILLTIVSNALNLEAFSTLDSTALLPVAILTITSERIALTIDEKGIRKTLAIMLQTLLIMALCFSVMESAALNALMIAFPELLLGVAALNFWIGSWTGIRITEMIRFRGLIFTEAYNGDE